MSLWSKFRKWYEPKFRVTNYDTYRFETEELPSSPLARLVRKLAKHWIGIITTIGVVFTVIAAIYTVRAFYAIPQAPQPQSIPAKPAANPKEAFTDKKIIIPDDAKLHNQSPATNRINDRHQVPNSLKDKLITTVIAKEKDPIDKLLPSEVLQSLSDFSPKVDFKYVETESGQIKEKEKTNRINHYLSNVGKYAIEVTGYKVYITSKELKNDEDKKLELIEGTDYTVEKHKSFEGLLQPSTSKQFSLTISLTDEAYRKYSTVHVIEYVYYKSQSFVINQLKSKYKDIISEKELLSILSARERSTTSIHLERSGTNQIHEKGNVSVKE